MHINITLVFFLQIYLRYGKHFPCFHRVIETSHACKLSDQAHMLHHSAKKYFSTPCFLFIIRTRKNILQIIIVPSYFCVLFIFNIGHILSLPDGIIIRSMFFLIFLKVVCWYKILISLLLYKYFYILPDIQFFLFFLYKLQTENKQNSLCLLPGVLWQRRDVATFPTPWIPSDTVPLPIFAWEWIVAPVWLYIIIFFQENKAFYLDTFYKNSNVSLTDDDL